MRRPGGRTSALAILVLGALALPGLVALVHEHSAPVLLGPLAELEVFSAEHEHPDPSEHVEAAARVGSEDCSACIQRPRKGVDAKLPPALTGQLPGDGSSQGAVALGPAAARTLATPRAPPLA